MSVLLQIFALGSRLLLLLWFSWDVGTFVIAQSGRMEWVQISQDRSGFVLKPSGQKFTPWGFNYDHDEKGRLLEDYWEGEWTKVEEDFREMKELGANVVRVHLQLGRFMEDPTRANQKSLQQLVRLVALAEKMQLYLDVTGLGCYHKQDVPAWYDTLSEEKRWGVQLRFWRAVANRCHNSPAIFCYDLMNEPVAPPSTGKRDDWLGPPFAGKHFVQVIALEAKGRARPAIARSWIHELAQAIHQEDSRHLITVGLVPWSLNKPGLNSGFFPEAIAAELDFISIHLYPEEAKLDEALETLRGFSVGKPIVIEEIFPLKCSAEELGAFIQQSRKLASGWIGFYWGKTLNECRASKEIADAMTAGWLELFQRGAHDIRNGHVD